MVWHARGSAASRFLHWCLRLVEALHFCSLKLYICTLYIGGYLWTHVFTWTLVICTADCQVYKNHSSLENLEDNFYSIEAMFTFVTLIYFELFLHFYIYFMVSFYWLKYFNNTNWFFSYKSLLKYTKLP